MTDREWHWHCANQKYRDDQEEYEKPATQTSYKQLDEIYRAYARHMKYRECKEELIAGEGYFYYWYSTANQHDVKWNREIVEMCTEQMANI